MIHINCRIVYDMTDKADSKTVLKHYFQPQQYVRYIYESLCAIILVEYITMRSVIARLLLLSSFWDLHFDKVDYASRMR